ncbi:MAG: hypothetical protein AB8B80_05485 [Marinicellaceae bacterium]
MCVLKIYSDTYSFKEFANKTDLPIFGVFDKGEYRNKKKTRKCKENVISLDVSEREWDDFPGQVKDAIEFLEKYFDKLSELINEVQDIDGYLDFPIYSRLNEDIVNQNDHISKALIALAGKLNLGIEMSQYSPDAFEPVS